MSSYRFELTKTMAAVIQLEAAFQLMLDSVYDEAAYSLIEAATSVIRDVSSHRNHPFFGDIFRPSVGSSLSDKAKFWRAYRHPTNFLKHADKDPSATVVGIDFIETNENGIIAACLGLYDLVDPLPDRLAIAFGTCAYAQSQGGRGYDVVGHMKATGGDVETALFMANLSRGELYLRAKAAWVEALPTHPIFPDKESTLSVLQQQE